MDRFDEIMSDYPDMTLKFEHMPSGLKGIAIGNQITINNEIPQQEQLQWLYEELGHVETSVGDISEYSSLDNMKQEQQARSWGIKHLLPIDSINKYKAKEIDSDFEVADELGVQVSYLHEAGKLYHLM
ncbi:ImmA/IrrE family metallo-endopeptidase [Lapidilactobacillus bayanensis]|uniref:ImmA/IrrE family metallo-endopeptidase n=1 Tax=Lapidilactobacillus bayanensis TaxID=2485998 RepID=UPI000F793D7D|nr:ImmA/IrrE family metallo-endopeptidase [Lapidilactobacillus bayanensis]